MSSTRLREQSRLSLILLLMWLPLARMAATDGVVVAEDPLLLLLRLND